MPFMGLGLHVIVALFFAIYLPSSKVEVVAKRPPACGRAAGVN